LRKKKREEINLLLGTKNYDKMEDDSDFKYLVKMPMDAVNEENVTKLIHDKSCKEKELSIIKNISINQMWIKELDNLKEIYLD
jgi:hypothetical protein